MKLQIKIGDETMDIGLQDICDALDTGVSVIIKERHNNPNIKKNEYLGVRYDIHIEVLKVLKSRLLLGAEKMRNRIPSKRRK